MRRILILLIAILVPSASTSVAAELRLIVSGLSNPVFVTHAGDDSRRLFIVEQPGTIKVLGPGSSSPTTFLDIRSRVLSGGERGLLGLAFHPLYRANGRFFVYYTRTPDGALVVAEYHVSSDANLASAAETPLLQIPHPNFSNHNGGMLAFGPGGFLFVGVGDGGSGNDPGNNAQNIESLLGKLLRLNVDRGDGSLAYSSPTGNPFLNAPGRDEIFALGLRNPWRFSFDRSNGQLWIGDVGQGAREEVNTPVTAGMNFGWRVFEGTVCSNNDPELCRNAYTRPLFDYGHTNGRCSLTGGYVYRGQAGALPAGRYVYGDYCSGELFTWDGANQSVLMSTGRDVASFGEDEDGELYVVSNAGSVSRLVSAACAVVATPSASSVPADATSITLRIDTGAGCAWSVSANRTWITFPDGSNGTGPALLTVSLGRYNRHLPARRGLLEIGAQVFDISQGR